MKFLIHASLLFALTLSGQVAAQEKSGHLVEQTHFCAEDESVEHPVPIPNDVRAILAKDESVQLILEDKKLSADKLPESWFSASSIHLSSSKEADLVVMAEGLLRGANVVEFWIFRATPTGHELVLSAPAHDLIVKKTRWKRFREIEISAETAVEFTAVQFRWDGVKYVEFR